MAQWGSIGAEGWMCGGAVSGAGLTPRLRRLSRWPMRHGRMPRTASLMPRSAPPAAWHCTSGLFTIHQSPPVLYFLCDADGHGAAITIDGRPDAGESEWRSAVTADA